MSSEAETGFTLSLSKPVMAHGEEVSELKGRIPTVEDIMKFGLPFSFSMEDEEINLKPKVMAKYLVACCDVPLSTVKTMANDDFMEAAFKVVGFLDSGASTPTAN